MLGLVDLRLLLLQVNLQASPRGLHGGAPDGNIGLGINLRPLFFACGNHLGQLAHAHGVKGVVFVQILKRCLIQRGQRDRIQVQSIAGQRVNQRLTHIVHKLTAVFVQFVHGKTRGHGPHRVNQFAFYQLLQLGRVKCAVAQGLRRARDALFGCRDRQIKLRAHVHAQPVVGDERFFGASHHFKAQRLHVHARDLVEPRKRERPAIHDHLAPADAGAHQTDLARGTLVKLGQNCRHHNSNNNPHHHPQKPFTHRNHL